MSLKHLEQKVLAETGFSDTDKNFASLLAQLFTLVGERKQLLDDHGISLPMDIKDFDPDGLERWMVDTTVAVDQYLLSDDDSELESKSEKQYEDFNKLNNKFVTASSTISRERKSQIFEIMGRMYKETHNILNTHDN